MKHTTPSTSARVRKIRQLSTGLVFERWGPDAAEMIGGGHFEAADDALSIRDQLEALGRPQLEVYARDHVRVHLETDAHIIDQLVPLIERGEVVFDEVAS